MIPKKFEARTLRISGSDKHVLYETGSVAWIVITCYYCTLHLLKNAIYGIIFTHPPERFTFSLHSTSEVNFHETLSEHYATRSQMAVTSIWQTRWSISKSLCISWLHKRKTAVNTVKYLTIIHCKLTNV
jgi:hypothetical protein